MRIADISQHEFVIRRPAVADSDLALARAVEAGIGIAFVVMEEGEGRHAGSASEFGAPHQTVVRDAGRHDNLLGVSGAYFAVAVVQNLEVGPILSSRVLGMRHKLNLHAIELPDKIVNPPANGRVLQLAIGLEMPKCEEVAFESQKGKLLNAVVDLPPHGLGIDDEFEYAAVFETDEQFVVVLLVHVLVQLFDLAQREVHQAVLRLYEDLVVAQDERHVFVLAVYQFAAHELVVHKDWGLAFDSLVFLYAQLFPALLRLYVVIPRWEGRYLVSASSSLACLLRAVSSFPPKLTT